MDWHKYFYYDETSPSCLRWKIDKGRRSKGDVVSKKTQRYYVVWLSEKQYCLHRIIYEMHFGKIAEGLVVDHINQDSFCNRIDNLRAITQVKNQRNNRKRISNTSGVHGVSLDEKTSGNFYWVASWNITENKQVHKSFSLKKFGAYAFLLACEYRKQMIEELNAQGAGYTEQHGR